MSTDELEVTETESRTPRWVGLVTALLAIISLAGLAVAWTATNRASTLDQNLSTMKQNQDVLGARLNQSEETTAQVRGELNVMADKMQLTQTELTRARQEATIIKKDDAKHLAEVESSMESKLATKASSDDVNKLGTDVTGVKTDVSGVKSDLDTTKNSLEMAKGEFGTLIARNHDEVEQLRRMGERDYFEFTLAKKGEKEKVGKMAVELRGTSTKKNQYSLALYVDDMRLEKKNRAVNEPIYFYTREYKAPLELVVNQVNKDKVVGYVSVPKNAIATPATAMSGGF
jgi:hypothetical protein